MTEPEPTPTIEDSRSIRAWCMYDWANSAYVTTTAAALFPVYFVQAVAPEGAEVFGRAIPASALWGFGVGIAALFVFSLAPVLGAIADYTALKKRFMMAFAYGGSLFASLLFLAVPGAVWLSLGTFVVAQICFISANVFYDAFLPQIVREDQMDRVSGRGYAYGYVGGGLQFAIALGLVAGHETLGLPADLAVRISLLMAGVWWAGFSIYTFKYLKEERPLRAAHLHDTGIRSAIRVGIQRTVGTARRLPKFKHLMLFLVAFFFYNDGIQTIISVASVYGGSELELSAAGIMVTFLMVQFIAIFGALLFSRLAEHIGTKRAVITSLIGWIMVVVFAYRLAVGDLTGYLILGGAVGLVLGGSQALSRSLYASMIPREASAEFFGIFSIFNKLSAIAGPLLFGLLTSIFGSARPAILAMIIFFVIGTILLSFVNMKKAREDRQKWSFEEADVKVEPAL